MAPTVPLRGVGLARGLAEAPFFAQAHARTLRKTTVPFFISWGSFKEGLGFLLGCYKAGLELSGCYDTLVKHSCFYQLGVLLKGGWGSFNVVLGRYKAGL